MISYLIDINVWLALSWRRHPCAGPALTWFGDLHQNNIRLLFCRVSQLGLLRMLTNEQVMGPSVLNTADALSIFDTWCEDPRVEFVAEPKGIEPVLRGVLSEFAKKSATKAIMDAYLVGFAETEKATLVTFDKALCTMAARRKTPHLQLSTR
jgi:toxin-antitoxin system PIN domain toxin